MGNDLADRASQISRWLLEARGDTPRARAAIRIGVSDKTLARWESGANVPGGDQLIKAARAYGRSLSELDKFAEPRDTLVPRGTGTVVRETSPTFGGEDAWSPNPSLKGKIPERAYEVAIAYCRRLQSAGVPRDGIEEVERLMIDQRYAQANKRSGRALTDDEWIMLIDATWLAVKAAAEWDGIRV